VNSIAAAAESAADSSNTMVAVAVSPKRLRCGIGDSTGSAAANEVGTEHFVVPQTNSKAVSSVAVFLFMCPWFLDGP
jgi:hypothetical protein